MITVGIVGGTGYTGAELLRLLITHPKVELAAVTSRTQIGERLDSVYPNLRGHTQLKFTELETATLHDCDLVFFATPNGTAMHWVPELLAGRSRIIDLAADFRLRDQTVWEQYYATAHACPELLSAAVYGLPEMYREQIKTARLIANPGCYPTAISLALWPLITASLLGSSQIIADAKSGVSGAGRAARQNNLFSEIAEDFRAYAASGHRHHPEIVQTLAAAADATAIDLTFVPHLLPIVRGIHATVYAQLRDSDSDVQAVFERVYQHEPFVDILPVGSHPNTGSVRGGNHCRIALHRPGNGQQLVILSVIDNLVKGAAGQAVQNMNIMFDQPETLGLSQPSLWP